MEMTPDQEELVAIVSARKVFKHHYAADVTGPTFAHTTGLTWSWEHPEVVVFGLEQQNAFELLDAIVADVMAGKRFTHLDVNRDLLEDFPVTFIRVDTQHYDEHFENAIWLYQYFQAPPRAFEVLQCVLPDPETGAFPWDDGWPEALSARQPLLGLRA